LGDGFGVRWFSTLRLIASSRTTARALEGRVMLHQSPVTPQGGTFYEALGDGVRRPSPMPKSKSRKRKSPKRVLALQDLEHAKTAVLNSLTSASGQRTYDHAIREFVAWYCSEPRLAFNRTVVLRYRIHLEQRGYAPATINLRLAAVRRIACFDPPWATLGEYPVMRVTVREPRASPYTLT
jgi:hypothetical protein